MGYEYKETTCSSCKKFTLCLEQWSNVEPWWCKECCSFYDVHWTYEDEVDEEDDRRRRLEDQ